MRSSALIIFCLQLLTNQIVLEGVRPRARRSRISNRSLEHIFGIICVRIHNFLLCSDEVPKSRASQ
jgi:hypothetical protein